MSTIIGAVSDIHAGSTVAVCPPTVSLDDGGHYSASKPQLWLWDCWRRYWDRVQSKREEREARLIVVINGDIVDGDHHNTSQILSRNPNAQAAVVNACMSVILDLNPDKILIIRGTESHVGQSASAEERIADGLSRDKRPIVRDDSSGTASWWHFKGECDGVMLDITHHGRTGQREHTRGGAAILHAHDIMASYVKRGEKPPHLCLRAHYHKFNDSHDACPVRVVTSGAWQLKTGYVHKVAADSLADVGGLIITTENREYSVEKVCYQPDASPLTKL